MNIDCNNVFRPTLHLSDEQAKGIERECQKRHCPKRKLFDTIFQEGYRSYFEKGEEGIQVGATTESGQTFDVSMGALSANVWTSIVMCHLLRLVLMELGYGPLQGDEIVGMATYIATHSFDRQTSLWESVGRHLGEGESLKRAMQMACIENDVDYDEFNGITFAKLAEAQAQKAQPDNPSQKPSNQQGRSKGKRNANRVKGGGNARTDS